MRQSNEICEKIRTMYPDVGECGIDITVLLETEAS